MIRSSTLLAMALLLAATELGGQSCPLPEGTLGYPIVASSDATLDPAYLTAVVEAAAFRWRVPSNRRSAHENWERVRSRVRTPEPRWADDWEPKDSHRARMAIVIRRDGRVVQAGPATPSGDKTFDRSLESIVREPMPSSGEFPSLPASFAGDSAVIMLSFGEAPAAEGAGVVRFAAQQRPVRLVPGTMNIVAPREAGTPNARSRRATVKYDVTAEGVVARGSIEVLQSSDPALTRAIEDALVGARFTPAQSNCRAVAQSVLQNFGQ